MIKLQEYQPGETVLNAGQLGKGFCILEEGTLEVIRDENDMTGADDDTFNDVVQEFSQMVYTHPERLHKKSDAAATKHS